jgi:hypothetical protein
LKKNKKQQIEKLKQVEKIALDLISGGDWASDIVRLRHAVEEYESMIYDEDQEKDEETFEDWP